MNAGEQAELNIRVLYERLQSETEAAWARKAAHEGRAFAIFTLNLGVVTLYLVVLDVVGLHTVSATPASAFFFIVSIIAIAASTVAAVAVALPSRYPALKLTVLKKMAEKWDSDDARYDEVIVDGQIKALEQTHKTNKWKALWVRAALIASGAVVVSFLLAIVTN